MLRVLRCARVYAGLALHRKDSSVAAVNRGNLVGCCCVLCVLGCAGVCVDISAALYVIFIVPARGGVVRMHSLTAG